MTSPADSSHSNRDLPLAWSSFPTATLIARLLQSGFITQPQASLLDSAQDPLALLTLLQDRGLLSIQQIQALFNELGVDPNAEKDLLHDTLRTALTLLELDSGPRLSTALPVAAQRPASGLLPLELQTRFGRYRVIRKLGQGNMGAVYLAQDMALDRQVAIKISTTEPVNATEPTASRFEREAKILAALQHPHICPVYDIGESAGRRFICMAYIEGQTLEQWLAARQRATPHEAARIVRQIALALEVAHDKGIVHRDLKPSNVMLRSDGNPILMDFGLASQNTSLAASVDQQRQTKSGQLLGTPAYLSPEQANGAIEQISPLSDVYSLGAMLFELLTGRPPFNGLWWQVVRAHAEMPAPLLRSVDASLDPHLETICQRALAKRPVDRFVSAQSLADALEIYLQSAGNAVPATPGKSPAGSWTSVALTAAAILMFLCTAFLFVQRSPRALTRPVSVETTLEHDPVQLADVASESTVEQIPTEIAFPPPQAQTTLPPPDLESLARPGKFMVEVARSKGAEVQSKAGWLEIVSPGSILEVVRTSGPWYEVDLPAGRGRLAATMVQPINQAVVNPLGMEFIWIPPGDFMMGSLSDEPDRAPNEAHHPVRLSRGFWLGKYEVTQREYTAVSGSNPSYFTQQGSGRYGVGDLNPAQLPVEQVNWEEATAFCQKLSQQDGLKYRLPTEAEWEYACRAGTTTPFSFGNQCSAREANCNGIYPYGTAQIGPMLRHPTTVGSYQANRFGLYDLHGNVWEWCADWYSDVLPLTPTTNPTGPANGMLRVMRGGGWGRAGQDLRSAHRARLAASNRFNMTGFRVVIEPSAK